MTSLPLPLARVLADEDARLYGDDIPVERRWSIRAEEIIDARALAIRLSKRLANPPENIARWREEDGHDPAYKARVAREVNAILDSIAPKEWLFENDAFADARVEPYASLERATKFEPDEVFNLNREMFDSLFPNDVNSAADLRFAEVTARIHERARNGQPRTALCISGGGIRSATYALGVLQGLAKLHILEKFDFLSTISGGGYIGGWLSSWVRRDPWGIRGVCALLSKVPNDPLDPEPMPIRHLRQYSNYLIPRLSLFSSDTWALVATYIRNVFLNWIVLIPLLAGVLAVPRLVFSGVLREPSGQMIGFTTRGAAISLLIGVVLLMLAFAVLIIYRPVVETKKTNTLTDGKFIMRCLLPLLGAAIAFLLAWAWHDHGGGADITFVYFLAGALVPTTSAFLFFLWRFLRSPFAQKPSEGQRRETRQSARILAELVGSVCAGITGAVLAYIAATQFFDEPVQRLDNVPLVRWPIGDPGVLSDSTAAYVCFGVPILLGILFLQCAVFVGASSHQNHDFDREWWARASGWVLLAALGWFGLSALTIYGPVAIYHLPGVLTAIGGSAGVFSVLIGRSSSTQGNSEADTQQQQSTTAKAADLAVQVAIPIFVVYILALISLGTTAALGTAVQFETATKSEIGFETRRAENATREYLTTIDGKIARVKETPLANKARLRSYEHLKIIELTPWTVALCIAVGSTLLALLISRCIGVNVFSMHALYRNRLVRAYLGASRWSRDPNKFTGFDPRDNLPMSDLRPEFLWWHNFRDIDNAIGLLANARTPRLELISREMSKVLGDELEDLFNPETARTIAQPAFYNSLNVLIATRDLAHLYDPKNKPATSDARRAWRTRRFIEVAFDESQVFPSPNPTFCAQDLLVSDDALRDAFKPGASPRADALTKSFKRGKWKLLDEINNVIIEGSLKDDPLFAATADPTPFDYGKAEQVDPADAEQAKGDPIHRMIDNRLRIEAAFPGLFEPLRLPRPLHVIGMCLNLTGGEDLAWQQRKGEAFSVSPLTSGCHYLGYRDTRTYGEISVGTAVTISGAAASPNQGYNTSAPLAFLMTLFNVRLGWWLGNPGLAGNRTYHRRNPRSSILPLVHELTGNANDKYPYVYLSDGGHFDNLGLYQMVLRRAHHIVLSDAGADPHYTYEDLGNAIRKIRIDLGVEIVIREISIEPPTANKPGSYCAYGDIIYSHVDGPNAVDGRLLYIKPVIYQNQGPRDVLNYATTSPTFPHEPTSDQFFTESQFESYRRLGLFAMDEICKGCGPLNTVNDLINAAQTSLKPTVTEII